jgi:site-specific DNA-methyltransferase (adenine-specific)
MTQIINGNCLDVMKELPDNSVDFILTDPPYGTTACKWDFVIPYKPMWAELKRIRKDNTAIALFGTEPFSSHLRLSNLKEYKYDWIWIKSNGVGYLNSKKMPLKKYENISIFYKKLPTYNPQGLIEINKIKKNTYEKKIKTEKSITVQNGGRLNKKEFVSKYKNYPNSILKFNNPKKAIHPTQKPTDLLEYLIKTYTKENETVLDFTMGCGSTGVACVNTNRDFIGIELDKEYFEIAEKRINEANN